MEAKKSEEIALPKADFAEVMIYLWIVSENGV